MIKFNDLSFFLKVAVISSFIHITLFAVGFALGVIDAFLN